MKHSSKNQQGNINIQYLASVSGKALLLTYNNRKYLFNCFEGFQRYSVEYGLKIHSINVLFMCSSSPISAVIGINLSLNTYAQKIEVICPSRIGNYFLAAKCLTKQSKLDIKNTENYMDGFLNVKMLSSGSESVNYLISFIPIRGRLRVEDIPGHIPKHFYKEFTNKKSIKIGDVTYNGSDYLEKSISPGSIAIIYDHLNIEYHFDILKDTKIILCFKYESLKLLAELGLENVYLLADSKFVDFRTFYSLQVKANSIYDKYLVPVKPREVKQFKLDKFLSPRDTIFYCKKENEFNLFVSNEEIEYKEKIYEREVIRPNIYFLGTGCAMPSKTRNVSSILVLTHSYGYLLDCGEDTLYQIKRLFGNYDILKKIDFIFISHSHADHHLGLLSFVGKCVELKNKIKIIGPSVINTFISNFISEFSFYSTDVAKKSMRMFEDSMSEYIDLKNYMQKFDFGYKISICGVDHFTDSCAIRVDTEDLKLSYSGDIKYSLPFAELSHNCDVMIHEATFCDELVETAAKTNHSTFSDAIKIWKRSKADFLVLTHYSQRYKMMSCDEVGVTLASDFMTFWPNRDKITPEIQEKLYNIFNNIE